MNKKHLYKSKFVLTISIAAIIFILCGCNKNVRENGSNRTMSSTNYSNRTDLRLFSTGYAEDEVLGIETFRLLIPDNWKVYCDIKWNWENYPYNTVNIFAENKKEEVKIWQVPPITYQWYLFSHYQQANQNSYYPMAPEDFIVNVILNSEDDISDISIVYSQDMLKTADLWMSLFEATMKTTGLANMNRTSSNTAVYQNFSDGIIYKYEIASKEIKVTYTQNNISYEHIFIGTFHYSFPQNTYDSFLNDNTGIINWGTHQLTSMRARIGELENHMEDIIILLKSIKYNNAWLKIKNELTYEIMKKKWQSIKSMLNSVLSRYSSGSSDYTYRNDPMDKIFDEFTEYIRDTETYYNPIKGEYYELPESKAAWTNGDEYIFSDDLSYNPNTDNSVNNLNWQRMEPK